MYVQSDTFLLAGVFENFRNMCFETYELDPAKFLSAPGLAWQLVVLTNIDMVIMVEKGIKRGICHSIYRYERANNEYVKDYDENKELSYIQYCDVNNLYG